MQRSSPCLSMLLKDKMHRNRKAVRKRRASWDKTLARALGEMRAGEGIGGKMLC